MKLVVSDLDGTLLNENSVISAETRETIHKLIESGVNFAIATGRGLKSTKIFRDMIGVNVYLICNNGANIYDKEENLIYENYISSNEVKKVLTYFREKHVNYNGFFNDELFVEDGRDESVITIEKGFETIGLEGKKYYPKMTKILIKDEHEKILKLKEDMIKKFSNFLDITMSSPVHLDIVQKDCTKGKGVKLISKKLNIPLSEVMVFGDGENDFDMMRIAGHPVIMENGLSSLQNKVENKAPKNSEDGVAKYLKKYFNL